MRRAEVMYAKREWQQIQLNEREWEKFAARLGEMRTNRQIGKIKKKYTNYVN